MLICLSNEENSGLGRHLQTAVTLGKLFHLATADFQEGAQPSLHECAPACHQAANLTVNQHWAEIPVTVEIIAAVWIVTGRAEDLDFSFSWV